MNSELPSTSLTTTKKHETGVEEISIMMDMQRAGGRLLWLRVRPNFGIFLCAFPMHPSGFFLIPLTNNSTKLPATAKQQKSINFQFYRSKQPHLQSSFVDFSLKSYSREREKLLSGPWGKGDNETRPITG